MSVDEIRQQIEREIGEHKILVYGKGTKDMPRCGFTAETIQFFDSFGYPYEVLAQITDWPTLPKVFIGGKFYGDTDILGPMHESGELKTVLAETFAGQPEPAPVIKLR